MADPNPAPEAHSATADAPALDIPVIVELAAADLAELAAFRAERDARNTAERRVLITDLVALGAEIPATAWTNGAPAPRLASEPLDALRDRVSALRAAKGAVSPAAVQPPTSAAGAVGTEADLEDFERRDAASILNPERRARFIASCLKRKQKAR